MSIFTRAFWLATAERAIRGGALVASGAWGLAVATDVNDLATRATLAGIGFVWGAGGSVLLSLAGSQIGTKGEPSFTGAETLAEEPFGDHEAL